MTGLLYLSPIAGTENPRNGGFISSEANGYRSRDQVLLAAVNDSATSYLAGVVLGKQTIGSRAAFAGSGTGCTCGSITLSLGVKQGVYAGECIKAGATGMFSLADPQGIFVGTVTVGTAFSGGGIAFTLTDAGGHVAVGDTITITVGTAAFANAGGATGNPTCGAITVQDGVVGGAYTFTYTDATHFTGVDPFGAVLAAGVDGTAYNQGGLTFTITAGGTPSIAGDQFTITTYTGNDLYYPVSATAYDGTQNAAGLLLETTYVGGATNQKVAVMSRSCEVKQSRLCWPATLTDDQQRHWINQLASLGIIVRGDLV